MKNIIILIVTLLTLVSCVKEPIAFEPHDGEVNVKFSLTTKSPTQTIDEKRVDIVRVIILHRGEITYNKMVLGTPDNEYEVKAFLGVNDFFVICNETPEMSAKLRNVTSVAELEAINFATPLTSPFVMYGKVQGEVIKIGENIVVNYAEHTNQSKLAVGVERLAAKVSLSFIKNSSIINKVSNIQISIHQRPEYSFIGANQAYSSLSHWLPIGNDVLIATTSPFTELTLNSTYKKKWQ